MHQVEQVTEFMFRVPSDTQYDKIYKVDLTPIYSSLPSAREFEADCTCQGYAMTRNKNKKHDLKVLIRGHEQYGRCKHLDIAIGEYERSNIAAIQQEKREKQHDAEEFERIKTIAALQATAKELSDG